MSAHLVADTLSEYGATTRVALADYLGPRRPQRHLYGLVADYPRRGGRMFRPSLCIASARVFGAAIDDVEKRANVDRLRARVYALTAGFGVP